MSWSGGPVTGAAAPYQQPSQQPYPNPQSGYSQQQPFQYGTQPAYGQYQSGPTYPGAGPTQRPPDARPPKKKGNPIITRYPPPPGYRGPAQPMGHFGNNQYPSQYQVPQPAYPSAPAPPSTYPSQGHGAAPVNHGYSHQSYFQQQPQNYQPSTVNQGQNHPWPQSGHTPGVDYTNPPGYPPAQGYSGPQNAYQGYLPQSTHVDPNYSAYGHVSGWSSQNSQAPYSQNHQYSSYESVAPSVQPVPDVDTTPTPAAASLVTSQAPQGSNQLTGIVSENISNGKPQLFLDWDDWEFDFDGAIWPKSNEPVDLNLSLGVIIWHPAKQMTRALPSTFVEAEEQALEPTPEKLDNGESVSMFFMPENSHEAFLDVRQTDTWELIKDDPVFVIFADEEMQNNLVSLEDCIAQRDRLDDIPDEISQYEDEEMQDANWDIMENLDQALSGGQGIVKRPNSNQEIALLPEQTQEDILAALGVTGLPKPLSDLPTLSRPPPRIRDPPTSLPGKPPPVVPSTNLPALPPLPSRAQTYGGHSNHKTGPAPQRAYGSLSSASHARPPPPPPPPPTRHQRYNPWNAPEPNGHGYDGARGSPAPSEGSNRTMIGSDFESEKPSVQPDRGTPIIPVLQRSDSSRKRSYEDTDQEGEKQRQQDDQTKRKRRLQVDAAYSRR